MNRLQVFNLIVLVFLLASCSQITSVAYEEATILKEEALFSLSPSESKIAFTSIRDGNQEIYLMDADGSNQTRLTNTASNIFDSQPTWNQDASKLAFLTNRDGTFEIYTVTFDGSSFERLTTESTGFFAIREPAWSPDGTKIVFTQFVSGESYEIFVMNADGSNPMRLTNNTAADNEPAWSPDGTKIVFASQRDSSNPDLYTMNIDGSDVFRLTTDGKSNRLPAWSPDGSKIAFTSLKDGNFELYTIHPDGSNQVRLTNDPAFDTTAEWSPDGSQIAFASQRDGVGFEIYVMDADGSNPIRLTNNTSADLDPSWQSSAVIDTTPPSISVSVTGTEGQNGWYTSDVNISFSITDEESEFSTSEGCNGTIISENTVGISISCEATSTGGTSSETVVIKLDKTAPLVTLTNVLEGSSYILGSEPIPSCVSSDATSGLASPATLTSSGEAVGTFTATCIGALDNAGNQSSPITISYSIIYDFDGFLSPIKNQKKNITKAGSSVPIKFRLAGYQGLDILESITSHKVNCSTGIRIGSDRQVKSNRGLKFSGNRYRYLWNTKKSYQGQCRELIVSLKDGTTHTAIFKFR